MNDSIIDPLQDMRDEQQARNLLAKHHRIAVIWGTDDVRGVRPDLTEEQAWEVLEQVADQHDASWGISWTTLETIADDMFPEPTSAGRES